MDDLHYWMFRREMTIQISSEYKEKESHEVTLHDKEIDKFVLRILNEVHPKIRERILSYLKENKTPE